MADQGGEQGRAVGRDPAAGGGDPDRLSLAQEALAGARAQAQAKGHRPAGPRPRQPVETAGPAVDDRPTAATEGGPGAGEGGPGAGEGGPGAGESVALLGSQPGPPGEQGSEQGRDGLPGKTVRRDPVRRESLRRVRRDDPQPLGLAIEGLLDSEGWTLAAATGSVFGRWAQIVGPELADHTQPEALRDGELTVVADSTAWATQLRLLAAQLVRRLNAELGPGAVKRVKVRGPVTATRRPGEWRVRGSRGPRDTYG